MRPPKPWPSPPLPPVARDRPLKPSSSSRKPRKCLFATRIRSGLRSSTLYQALVLFTEGRLFEARRLCAAAHEFFRNSPMRGKAVLAELLLARIACASAIAPGHNNTARTRSRKDLENPGFAPPSSIRRSFCWAMWSALTGNEDAAYESYCRARAAVERLRSSLRGEELKIAFFENKLEVYESLVDICLRRRTVSKRRLLHRTSQIPHPDRSSEPARARATAADPGQSELVRSIRNLPKELNWYYNLIEREQLRPEERSQESVQQLEQQARSRESDLMRAMKEATVAEANEAGLQVPTSMSLDEIRSVLPADAAMVEFSVLHERNIACV
jgi:hypothetical protein